jgi:trigger factor
MKVEEIKTKGLDIEWNVTVPAIKINEKINERYLKIAATVKLPGFRPGKVPMNIIKQRYSASVLPEVLDEMVNSTLKKAVVEKKIQPSVQPKVDIKKFEEGSELVFNVSFQKMPDIKEIDLKKITVEKPVLEIEGKDIDKALMELADKHERFEPLKAKRNAKKGDLVLFDYDGKINDKSFEGNKGVNETVVLGSNKYIPGYEEQMIGISIDEEKNINVTFPNDYRVKDIAGKEAIFSLKIKDIQSRVKNIAIDEKLAKEMGEKDLESLKNKIKDKMTSDYNQFSSLKVRREITEKVLSISKFDIPSKMIEEEVNFMKNQDNKKSDKEIKELATRRVKLGLILNSVGKNNKIEVNDKDLTQAVVSEAQKYPGDEKKVVDFYQKNPQMMNNLKGLAFEEKVLNFISNVCILKPKNYTFDDLFNTKQLEPEKNLVKNKKKGEKNE